MSAKDRKIKRAALLILCVSSLFVFAGCGAESSDMGQGISGENSVQEENSDEPKEDVSGAGASQGENAGDGTSGEDKNNIGEDNTVEAGENNSGADSAGADGGNSSGNNSDASVGNGVLSEEKVKEIVLEDSNIADKDAFFIKVRLEREDGVLVYDVEFYVGDKEYEYTVDPVSGKILEKEIENKHD